MSNGVGALIGIVLGIAASVAANSQFDKAAAMTKQTPHEVTLKSVTLEQTPTSKGTLTVLNGDFVLEDGTAFKYPVQEITKKNLEEAAKPIKMEMLLSPADIAGSNDDAKSHELKGWLFGCIAALIFFMIIC
jgi:hypothetical protein